VLLIDPPTALVLLLTGPVLVLLLAVIGGRTRIVSGRRALELRWLGAFFLDMLQGLATLRMFGRGREQVETIRAVSRQYGETTMDVLRTAFQTALVLEWGAAVATAVVAVEVSLRLIDGQMPFDRALAVLVITPEFFLPLRQLAIRYHSGSAGRAAAERLFEILDTPLLGHAPAISAVAGEGAPIAEPPRGDIRFEDIWFSYDGRDPALRGLDLAIPEGSVVALIGATGAGKTTCSSLLLRFMEPDSGRITVGGSALDTVDRSTWLDAVAWVPQRPHLFHGTVADNIRLGRPDATDEQVRAAARAADAAGFIEALPQGYATHVGEAGDRLSGGQRQRVAIARAYLKDAPYLILDEATSHLDAASEAAIGGVIRDLIRGRTVLIISHRMRFAALADRVITLADGRAVAT
jgi:ATP-binding cassette, subfamily C, bacterial CydD